MPKKVPPAPVKSKRTADQQLDARKSRNFPRHTLEEVLTLPQKIQDEMGGKPMKRLLLADALDLSPSSSNFRDLLSSSYKYGLTDGTEKADIIALTQLGGEAAQQNNVQLRLNALRKAALSPSVFGQFFRDYANRKLPSTEMFPKILASQYNVPTDVTGECAAHVTSNGRFVQVIRDIGGSPHIILDSDIAPLEAEITAPDEGTGPASLESPKLEHFEDGIDPPAKPPGSGPRPIFVGHGKNKKPLQQLQNLLTTFRIPHKVVVDEANLGRPISQKVRDTIVECGSAILIFTRDEKFYDETGSELWRPSENVVHELGATSYAYQDRIVVFKEKGLYFPTNYQSIGYIEFETDDLAARTADLLKELIGFGLIQVTPTQ